MSDTIKPPLSSQARCAIYGCHRPAFVRVQRSDGSWTHWCAEHSQAFEAIEVRDEPVQN